ncbi:SdpI family protein [Microbacterium sp. AGC62]
MPVIAVIFPALLLLTAVLTELASRGRLRRNRLAGIRTNATMRSDAAWSASHRAAAKTVWIGFVVSLVAALIALFAEGTAALIAAVAVAAVFLATSVVSLLQANRAGAVAHAA